MSRNATNSTASGLSSAQDIALSALLAGQTVTAAAERAGVGRETLHRWLRKDKAFGAAYDDGKAELRDMARVELHALVSDAVARLRAIVKNPTPTPAELSVQFKAVMYVLGMVGSGEPEEPTNPALELAKTIQDAMKEAREAKE